MQKLPVKLMSICYNKLLGPTKTVFCNCSYSTYPYQAYSFLPSYLFPSRGIELKVEWRMHRDKKGMENLP